MSKSRNMLALSITALFVLVFGVTGWCGGPVDSGRAGAEQIAPRGTASSGDGAAQGGGFSMSGTGGSGNAGGVDGASPYINLGSLGMQNTFAYGVRAVYSPKKFLPSLKLTGDYLAMNFKGSTAHYDSFTFNPILVAGNGAEGKLDVALWSLTGDFMPSLGAGEGFSAGPRLQVLFLNDKLELTNTTTSNSVSEFESHTMFGIGFASKIGFSELSGRDMGFDPYFTLSASIGQGGKMRYWTWEISGSIFRTRGDVDPYRTSRIPSLGFGAEIGYMQYSFASHNQDEEFYPGWVLGPWGGNVRPKELRYDLRIPFVRGTLTF